MCRCVLADELIGFAVSSVQMWGVDFMQGGVYTVSSFRFTLICYGWIGDVCVWKRLRLHAGVWMCLVLNCFCRDLTVCSSLSTHGNLCKSIAMWKTILLWWFSCFVFRIGCFSRVLIHFQCLVNWITWTMHCSQAENKFYFLVSFNLTFCCWTKFTQKQICAHINTLII